MEEAFGKLGNDLANRFSNRFWKESWNVETRVQLLVWLYFNMSSSRRRLQDWVNCKNSNNWMSEVEVRNCDVGKKQRISNSSNY